MSACGNWGRTNLRRRGVTRDLSTLERAPAGGLLPYGNGRSYGDTCLNDAGRLIDMRDRDRLLSFDPRTGRVRAEAGMMLSDLVALVSPYGFFPPVVPGTRFVTLGGMLANDVHGKNHHRRGTFGAHVRRFALARSDGTQVIEPGHPFFAPTIGGMGLTGVVTWLEFDLTRVAGGAVRQAATPFANLAEYFERIEVAEDAHEYAVAWVDALATGDALGRGVLLSGDHVAGDVALKSPRLSVPFTPPVPLVGRATMRPFNALYRATRRSGTVSAVSFFWPLDAVGGWNRLYGPRGLHQHQSVIPHEAAAETLPLLLRTAQDADHASFLTVLKRFGPAVSPGTLSFPRPGHTLTLDFAHRGRATLDLLDRLDAITLDAGGRTAAYKDARMSAETFQRGYPWWRSVEKARDPALMSDFWRRCIAREHVEAPPLQHEPELETA